MSEDDKIKRLTNEVQAQAFETEMGQKVLVQRDDLQGEKIRIANETLEDIGKFLSEEGGMEYKGSAAVHVYASENLKMFQIASQTNTLGKMNEQLASKAIEDLKGSAMEFYGRTRQTKRSGF